MDKESDESSNYREEVVQLLAIHDIDLRLLVTNTFFPFITYLVKALFLAFTLFLLILNFSGSDIITLCLLFLLLPTAIDPLLKTLSSINYSQIQMFIDLGQPIAANAEYTYFSLIRLFLLLIMVIVLLSLSTAIVNSVFFTSISSELELAFKIIILTSFFTLGISGDIEVLLKVQGRESALFFYNCSKYFVLIIILEIEVLSKESTEEKADIFIIVYIFLAIISIFNIGMYLSVVCRYKGVNVYNNSIRFNFKYLEPFRYNVIKFAIVKYFENVLSNISGPLLILAGLMLEVKEYQGSKVENVEIITYIKEVFILYLSLVPIYAYCEFLQEFISTNNNLGLSKRIFKLVFEKSWIIFVATIFYESVLYVSMSYLINNSYKRTAWNFLQNDFSIDRHGAFIIYRQECYCCFYGILVFPWYISITLNSVCKKSLNNEFILEQIMDFLLGVCILVISCLIKNKNAIFIILARGIGQFLMSFAYLHISYIKLKSEELIDFKSFDEGEEKESISKNEESNTGKGISISCVKIEPRSNDEAVNNPDNSSENELNASNPMNNNEMVEFVNNASSGSVLTNESAGFEFGKLNIENQPTTLGRNQTHLFKEESSARFAIYNETSTLKLDRSSSLSEHKK